MQAVLFSETNISVSSILSLRTTQHVVDDIFWTLVFKSGEQCNMSHGTQIHLLSIIRCRHAITLATWEQQHANIAQTIDVLPEVREGWSSYIESTHSTGELLEDSSAVHDTDLNYSNYS